MQRKTTSWIHNPPTTFNLPMTTTALPRARVPDNSRAPPLSKLMLTVSTTASQSKKWLPPPTSSTSLPTVLKTIPSSTVTRTWTTSQLTVTVLSQRTSSLNSKRLTTSWMLKSSTITRKSLRRVRRRKDMTRWSQFKKPYLKTTTVMSHTTLLTLKTHMECQSMMNTFQVSNIHLHLTLSSFIQAQGEEEDQEIQS